MITELRRYSIIPGRMDEMHARMTDLLLPLFADLTLPFPRAIWDSREEQSVFTWICEWESFDARTEGWARYNPHFFAARMKQDIQEYVTRTDVTLIKPWRDEPLGFPSGTGACETLWIAQPIVLHGADFRTACLKDMSALFRNVGATAVNGCDIVFGPLPNAAVFISWPNAATRSAGMAGLSRQSAPEQLRQAVAVDASICDHGVWEQLDRAAYLQNWRTV
jgi:hypothetical protein